MADNRFAANVPVVGQTLALGSTDGRYKQSVSRVRAVDDRSLSAVTMQPPSRPRYAARSKPSIAPHAPITLHATV